MLRTILEPNKPITQEDVTSFSERYRLNLPKSYVAFLLKNNGGQPEPAVFSIENFKDNPSGVIQAFFGLNANISTEDLDYILTEECQNIPAGILPIACTGTGDYVCLDLRKPDCPVVFWDRKPFWGANIWNEQDLYPVADDFESFVAGLRDELT